MKTAKIVMGIISIVLSVQIYFTAKSLRVLEIMENTLDLGGTTGYWVAVLMFLLGIVTIVARSSRGGSAFCMFGYMLTGYLGITYNGIYEDLVFWGALCLFFAVLFLAFIFCPGYQDGFDYEEEENPEKKQK